MDINGKNLKPEFPDLKLDTKYIVYIMILLYTAGFSYYTILRHHTFLTQAYDMGIFLNSFYNTLHGGGFFYTTLWEGSRFENHFGPILFLILPLYAVFPKAETLLILQSFILALGALPIYWIAKKEINNTAGVIFALLYLLYPALHGINLYDFHEVAMAPTLILFSFYYFKEKRFRLSGIFIILALISREDVAMVIVPMAAFWLYERKGNWSIKDKETIFCMSTILLGLIWFFITAKFIIPYYNPQGYWFVTEYKPEFFLLNLKKKSVYIIKMLSPLLFVPLLNKLMIVGLPIFARNLLSNRTTRFRISNQHQALLVPFIFLSSIYFFKDISGLNINPKFAKRLLYSFASISFAISFYMSPVFAEISQNIIVPSSVPNSEGWPPNIKISMAVTPHDRALNQLIDIIPINDSIYVQHNIFPHLANRNKVYYVQGDKQIFKGWNNPQIGGAIVPWKYTTDFEYILMDDSSKYSMLRRIDIESLDTLEKNYGVYIAIDKIYLLKRGYTNSSIYIPSLMDNFDNQFIPNYYNGITISYYNNNNLSGIPVLTDRSSNINLIWDRESPIPGIINYHNFSIRFDGYLYIPMNGSYTFQLLSGDGSRLFIDDNLVIDAWSSGPSVDANYNSIIYKGLHKIRVDYKKDRYRSFIRLKWVTPWGVSTEPIPEEYFYFHK